MNEYLNLSVDKFHYSEEQALGMLYWLEFNIEKAMEEMPNFTPFVYQWTLEDKVLFEQAFQIHNKEFNKIRQMVNNSNNCLIKLF